MSQVSRWLEITFVLIVLYLVLSRALGFSSVVRSLGNVYVAGVQALQGR
jgi:hypothetical protein